MQCIKPPRSKITISMSLRAQISTKWGELWCWMRSFICSPNSEYVYDLQLSSAWWAAVHGVAGSRTWLSDFTFTFHFSLFTFMHWRRKWQPTPVFLPGESQGWGSVVGCRPWGRTESDRLKRFSSSSSSPSLKADKRGSAAPSAVCLGEDLTPGRNDCCVLKPFLPMALWLRSGKKFSLI